MPRKTAAAVAAAGSPEVTTTIRMPNTQPPPEPAREEQPFFWQRVSEIPAEKWEKDIELWIYRLEPKVRMATGERGYLDILSQPITPVYIKKRWGGGTFRIMVLEKGKILYSTIEEIEGDPIYDKRREVPGDGAGSAAAVAVGVNADFQREFISVLREELARSRESTQGATQGTDEIVKMLTNASDKAMDIVTKQTPQAQSGVSQIKDMVAALKEMGILGGATATTNPLLDKFLTVAMERLLAPPKSLKDQLEEVKALGELLGGAGEGNPKDWKAMGVKALVDHLPEILDALKTSTTGTISAAQARRVPPPGAAPGTRAPVTRPAAQPVPAPPAPAIHVTGGLEVVPRESTDTAAPVPIESVAPAPEPETQEQYDAAMKIQMVNMMRMGASGGSIASFLEDVKPEMAKDLTKYDSTTIRNFFLQDAVLRLMVEDPRWDEVLADAKDYLAEPVLTN